MGSIFITGNSNGLGLGLTRYYLQQGATIYSISRSAVPLQDQNLQAMSQDLADLDSIDATLKKLLPASLDLVILNAGILGQIQDLADTSQQQIRQVMDINVWANKIIIDYLIKNQIKARQLILMSSGASVNGNRGWGAYAISKAALNMLARLYADEMPDTHITAFAPGLVHTRMQDYLCQQVDTRKFGSIQNLVKAYHTEMMPDIDSAAGQIAAALPTCLEFSSGSFVDLRHLRQSA